MRSYHSTCGHAEESGATYIPPLLPVHSHLRAQPTHARTCTRNVHQQRLFVVNMACATASNWTALPTSANIPTFHHRGAEAQAEEHTQSGAWHGQSVSQASSSRPADNRARCLAA